VSSLVSVCNADDEVLLRFLQVMAEYFLIAETSAVTLTIAGVVKEVVTIVVSKNISDST